MIITEDVDSQAPHVPRFTEISKFTAELKRAIRHIWIRTPNGASETKLN